jgi:hypothetical protein
VTGSLPDGLWMLSGILFLRALLWNDKKQSDFFITIFCIAGLAGELLQLSSSVRGTFDIKDLCYMAAAIAVEKIFMASLETSVFRGTTLFLMEGIKC